MSIAARYEWLDVDDSWEAAASKCEAEVEYLGDRDVARMRFRLAWQIKLYPRTSTDSDCDSSETGDDNAGETYKKQEKIDKKLDAHKDLLGYHEAYKTTKELLEKMNLLAGRPNQDVRGHLTAENVENLHITLAKLFTAARDKDEALMAIRDSQACHVKNFSAIDLPALRAKLEPYTSGEKVHLVKQVTIHMRAAALKGGVVLVDLPGLGDIDPSRSQVTKAYRKAHNIHFIVAKRQRLLSDHNLVHIITNAIESNHSGAGGVVLMLTNCDAPASPADIQKTVQKGIGPMPQLSQWHRDAEAKLAEQDKIGSEGSTSTDEDDGQSPQVGEDIVLEHYIKYLEKMQARYHAYQNNKDMAQTLKEQYKDKSGRSIRVFCISSHDYMEHMKPFRFEHQPVIEAEQTGYPEVRFFMKELIADLRFNTIQEFVTDDIRALIDQVCRLTRKCEPKDDIPAMLREVDKAFSNMETIVSPTILQDAFQVAKSFLGTDDTFDKDVEKLQSIVDMFISDIPTVGKRSNGPTLGLIIKCQGYLNRKAKSRGKTRTAAYVANWPLVLSEQFAHGRLRCWFTAFSSALETAKADINNDIRTRTVAAVDAINGLLLADSATTLVIKSVNQQSNAMRRAVRGAFAQVTLDAETMLKDYGKDAEAVGQDQEQPSGFCANIIKQYCSEILAYWDLQFATNKNRRGMGARIPDQLKERLASERFLDVLKTEPPKYVAKGHEDFEEKLAASINSLFEKLNADISTLDEGARLTQSGKHAENDERISNALRDQLDALEADYAELTRLVCIEGNDGEV
ncbi:hypothetical protein J1614_011706 [Plenodomus biglobosus]|nr:hypothetical protein J1614_011706 [Plenodomus biglobosus]